MEHFCNLFRRMLANKAVSLPRRAFMSRPLTPGVCSNWDKLDSSIAKHVVVFFEKPCNPSRKVIDFSSGSRPSNVYNNYGLKVIALGSLRHRNNWI
jgi:hypothetical protein